ncbi:response regulator transcription factor [Taibaiella helva]|uniref:response regulator transcription factor n=1 Tax=Taibaiella helva TaxID=2301235 RepID=UPI000E574A13|nr:response regulator transcription factor [Taibaiella helva]
MIRIALIEDHNIVRNGIKTLLNKEEDMEVVAEAAHGEEALKLLEEGLRPDVVLSDINMPDVDGLSLCRMVMEHHPGIKFIILSMYDQVEYINQAFKNGALGYILKNVSPDELTFAIRHICLREERYICSELAIRMLERQIQSSDICLPEHSEFDFTKRELEILTLVSEGYTNQEIADRLYTSKRTVEGHRQSLIEKTGVRNSSALIRYALINGLIR